MGKRQKEVPLVQSYYNKGSEIKKFSITSRSMKEDLREKAGLKTKLFFQ